LVSTAAEGERADARAIRSRHELRGGAGRFREEGPHLRGGSRARLAVHAARDLSEPHALLQHARQRGIGVAIEIEQPHRGIVACGRQPRRGP
jgi:hypothetical protein